VASKESTQRRTWLIDLDYAPTAASESIDHGATSRTQEERAAGRVAEEPCEVTKEVISGALLRAQLQRCAPVVQEVLLPPRGADDAAGYAGGDLSWSLSQCPDQGCEAQGLREGLVGCHEAERCRGWGAEQSDKRREGKQGLYEPVPHALLGDDLWQT